MVVQAKQKAKKTKKQRKFGRSAVYCELYRRTNRRAKNKIVRLKKHLIRFPDDKCATNALNLYMLMV